MPLPFKDQVALVTGGTAGIGLAIAEALSGAGARVCVTGRGKTALDAAGRSLGALALAGDMGDEASVRDVAIRVTEQLGGVDMLIQNAGTWSGGAVESASLADFDRQWQVNVRGPYLLTQLLLPTLKQRRGQIVFINSSSGARSHAHVSQYAATKFALKAIADALREEVNEAGVRVISVFPGKTATPLQERIMTGSGRPYHPERLLQPVEVAEVVTNSLALPRGAEVTDVHVRPMRKA